MADPEHDPVASTGGRSWPLGALALGFAAAVWIVVRAITGSDLAFLERHGDAPWVVPVRDMGLRARSEPLPATEFVLRVSVDAIGARPKLRLRALEHHEIAVNAGLLGARREGDWKAGSSYSLSDLRRGENELVVRVDNPRGTPALWFESDDVEPPLRSGPEVRVRTPAGLAPVRLAEERIIEDESLVLPRPVDAWRRHLVRMLLLAGAVLALVLGFERVPATVRARLARPRWWGIAVGLFGLALYVNHVARVQGGFDSGEHMRYVMALADGRVPDVREGYQTYQPPLYYALAGGSLALLQRFGPGAALVGVTWLPGLSFVIQVLASAYLARLLFPGRTDAWLLAGLFAACAPVNLYMSAFISNEPLAAALSGLGLVFAVRAALDPARSVLPSAVCFGLSLLTKITCVLYLPLVAFVLLWSDHVRATPWSARARKLALFAAVVVAVASFGLYRAWSQVGSLLPGNWDESLGFRAWWQDPGFVTPRTYLDFGTVLERPWYAGFASFWDGLYSTFWGDGLTGGLGPKPAVEVVRWNWDHMAIGYWLALPITLALVLGAALGARALFRERGSAWALVTGAAAATLLGILYMTLRVPSYAQVKAHYGLAALVGIASLFALAVVWLSDRGAAWRRAAWFAVLLFAANSWITFWAV